MDYKGCRPLLRTGCRGSPLRKGCTDSPTRTGCKGSLLRRGCRDLPPHTGCRGSPPRMDYKGCTLLLRKGCRGSPPRRDCRDYKLQGPASLRMDCMGYRPLLRTGYSRRRDCTDCTPPRRTGVARVLRRTGITGISRCTGRTCLGQQAASRQNGARCSDTGHHHHGHERGLKQSALKGFHSYGPSCFRHRPVAPAFARVRTKM